MNILVYKRTHNGDPGSDGCFGVHDCMGAVRDRDYDAVIGVGGMGPEAQSNGIAGTVNWIGIGPHKKYVGKRGPEVTFDRFVYFGSDGPDFYAIAPKLAKRMYQHKVRSLLQGLSEAEMTEALTIISLANDAPPSPAFNDAGGNADGFNKCKRKGRTVHCNIAANSDGLKTVVNVS